jgi:hypothetical protein
VCAFWQPKALLRPAALLLDRFDIACRHTPFPRALGNTRGDGKLPGIDTQLECHKQRWLICDTLRKTSRCWCCHALTPSWVQVTEGA